jgi:hypothetical protein
MFIHIGSRKTVSEKNVVGIFNSETLRVSDINEYYTSKIDSNDKTVVVLADNSIESGIVSPFTVITRTDALQSTIWRR